jgi:hypothetical protein
MPDQDDFEDLKVPDTKAAYSWKHVEVGLPVSKTVRLRNFSPDEFEQFVQEWLTTLPSQYDSVKKSSGAGDKGIDVAGFYTQHKLKGEWDNYQCKQYSNELRPTDVYVELGKIIYYSFKKEYIPPRRYFFVSRLGVGTKLERMIQKGVIKSELEKNWDSYCKTKITKDLEIPLVGDLKDYFDGFDFSIFDYKTAVDLVDEHSKTPYHAVRFGGGLPDRPPVPDAPVEYAQSESRYIEQILSAYSDHLSQDIKSVDDLSSHPKFQKHFFRQREYFFHTECLKRYARDSVPPGTFENLLVDFKDGVINVAENDHSSGFVRMNEVLSEATKVSIDSNALKTALRPKDRQGACHHLANDDELIWVPEDE